MTMCTGGKCDVFTCSSSQRPFLLNHITDVISFSPFCLKGRVIRGAYKFQAVITTFEMILGGCPELNAIEWRCVIIDEAHRLKNKNCKLLEGFKLMNLVYKHSACREK